MCDRVAVFQRHCAVGAPVLGAWASRVPVELLPQDGAFAGRRSALPAYGPRQRRLQRYERRLLGWELTGVGHGLDCSFWRRM